MPVPPKTKAVEKFLIVIEKANGNYSAYCPDLAGCIATGKTIEEVKQRMGEAIKMHLEGMREDNIPLPAMKSQADYISLEL
jgi:predicted RNase H-like HicB family nuclease